ncbi:MAG: hypothetical protein COT74_01765 [Bdellovibrionales bacterium CG10_big_fil_rev_8_21_14_0_10_45_34]|nr:MAG: hypothetical protein COT74_01765 [Bdellovibrionales bacterium CG10_big_fil_rev_8_21_14_0_10_45_34]
MRILSLLFSALLLTIGCGRETTKTEYVTSPEVKTVEVPIPGTREIVAVPQVIFVDKGFGIVTIPRPIEQAPESLKKLGHAVAKIMRIDGASGTGFFVSEDGLFLTNEHVVPIAACIDSGCPGIKIVHNFSDSGVVKEYYNFRVIAQAGSDKGLDFTLLKVILDEGEQVPYLDLEFDDSRYDFSDQDSRAFKALGHPGGAALSFTNVQPIIREKFDLDLKGLLISGNSGGPLVDESTGKVVGLLKAVRTSFVRESDVSAAHQTRNRATSVIDLFRQLKVEKVQGLDSIEGYSGLVGKGESVGLTLPLERFPKPSAEIFTGALRRDSQDFKGRQALTEFDKYIGTFDEQSVLDLMVVKHEFTPGDLNVDLLLHLFKKQVLIGRPLGLSSDARRVIEKAIEWNAVEEGINPKISVQILLNYFDGEKRTELQSMCREALPDMPAVYGAWVYSCVTTTKSDGTSLITKIVEQLTANSYKNLNDFGIVTGFLMFLSVPSVKDQQDLDALRDLQRFVDQEVEDIEFLAQNKSILMNIIKGLVGPGSFRKTFASYDE